MSFGFCTATLVLGGGKQNGWRRVTGCTANQWHRSRTLRAAVNECTKRPTHTLLSTPNVPPPHPPLLFSCLSVPLLSPSFSSPPPPPPHVHSRILSPSLSCTYIFTHTHARAFTQHAHSHHLPPSSAHTQPSHPIPLPPPPLSPALSPPSLSVPSIFAPCLFLSLLPISLLPPSPPVPGRP